MKLLQVTMFHNFFSTTVILVDFNQFGNLLDVLEESSKVRKYFVRDMEDGQELLPDDMGFDVSDYLKWKKYGVAEVSVNGHVRRLAPVPEEKCQLSLKWTKICNEEF